MQMTEVTKMRLCTLSLNLNDPKRLMFLILLSAAVFLVLERSLLSHQIALVEGLSKVSESVGLGSSESDRHRAQQLAACVFPEVNPLSADVMKRSGLHKGTLHCKHPRPDLTYVADLKLVVNKTRVLTLGEFRSCRYREIFRHDMNENSYKLGDWSRPFTSSVRLPEQTEFLLAVCTDVDGLELSRSYHTVIPVWSKLAQLEAIRQRKRLVETRPKETLNVIMVGLDGVSRHQFLRSMNRTRSFLMDEMKSFDMSMYTQLGVNTFPNFLPLLTGKLEQEVRSWWQDADHADVMDILWQEFERAGYRTMYTEDWPSVGAFHYLKKGFLSPPTTYYSHVISFAMDMDKEISSHNKWCVGNQAEIDFHLNYVEQMFDTVTTGPLFALVFNTKLTHDDITNAVMADEHIYRFYRSLQQKGHLNNTLLLTFSDHGPRWGAIRASMNGMVESRTPYAIFTFPQWFLEKYPDVAQNLKTNTGRLTSHFDTHATLQDLLYFKASGVRPFTPGKHGISLFREIPLNRTCDDVPIPVEFCVCNQQQMEQLPTNSSLALGFAQLILNSINWKRNASICLEFKLTEVLQVVQLHLPRSGVETRLFKVKVLTSPGDAVFEGTIAADGDDDTVQRTLHGVLAHQPTSAALRVGDTLERLTFYAGQADCEPQAARRPFCFCKDVHSDVTNTLDVTKTLDVTNTPDDRDAKNPQHKTHRNKQPSGASGH